MNLINDAAEKIADRLSWHTASRDQAGIAKDIADGKDIKEVYGLGEAGLFDEFFCSIRPEKAFSAPGPEKQKKRKPGLFFGGYPYLPDAHRSGSQILLAYRFGYPPLSAANAPGRL
jgi:hypothetical protein